MPVPPPYAERPVSFSETIVPGLLRDAGGVAALNAGVDQILVSYDPTQYFTMMNALITANRAGGLTPATLARSARRLAGTAR
jgi:hypothetical protein